MKPAISSLSDAFAACKQSIRAMALFSLATNILSLTPIFYMINVYDKAVTTASYPTLIALVVIAGFLYVIQGFLEWIRSLVLVYVAKHLDKLLSERMFNLCFDRESGRSGMAIGAQPLRDLNALRQFVAGPTAAALFDVPWIPVFMLIMFFFHPWLFIVGLLCLATLTVIAILNQRKTTSLMQDATEKASYVSNQTQLNLRNAEAAAVMGMMGPLTERWRVLQDDTITAQTDASSVASGYGAVIKVAGIAMQSIAITTGAVLAMAQEISPGVVIGAALLLGKTLQPMQQVVTAWKQIVEAHDRYRALDKLLKDSPELAKSHIELPKIAGAISASKAVVVPPGGEEPTLHDIDLALTPGLTTMVLGASAAGKSSLIRAILGLWPAAKGEFRIDGADVHKINRAHIGPQIGYLPQAIELFTGSIAENIARFGDLSPEPIFQAARDAGVHEMILALPDGYDSMLGDASVVLSPGQRQRIALARALYGRPRLLVLDEPNSNLDEAGEAALHRALSIMKQAGSSIILVSHRHGALPLVDHLIIMEFGRIALQGPKAEVLEVVRQRQAAQNQIQPDAPQSTAAPTSVEMPSGH